MPLKICAHPGCRVLVPVGTTRCKDHEQEVKVERWTRGNRQRHDPASRRLYRSKRWDVLRRATLRRDLWQCQWPGCGVPLLAGRRDPRAAVVDHIEPHQGDWDLFHDPGNLWSLCKSHHDGAKQAIEARAAALGVPVADLLREIGAGVAFRPHAAAR